VKKVSNFIQNKINFSKLVLFLGMLFSASSFFIPEIAFAQATNTDFGVGQISSTLQLGGGNLITIASRIINVVLGILGIIALAVILYGGYQWMTASGNEEKVQSAKDTLINGVIGLAIILASYTIVSFVINQFGSATGSLSGDNRNERENQNTRFCMNGNCTGCNPVNDFYAQSITPSTTISGDTKMNNIAIRAVFSQPIGELPSSTNTSTNGLTIERKEKGSYSLLTGKSSEFNVSLKHNDRILVATSSKQKQINTSTYQIKIADGIENNQGETTDTKCSIQSEKFISKTVRKDDTPPKIHNLSLAGENASPKHKDRIIVNPKERMRVSADIDDRDSKNFGGVGFVKVEMYPSSSPNNLVDFNDGGETKNYIYSGPEKSSSKEYNFSFKTSISNNFNTGTKYIAKFTAYDIDHNSSTVTTTFEVQEANCSSCSGAGGPCQNNADCKKYLDCKGGRCLGSPIITDFSPNSGTSTTWVTVRGRFFGFTKGPSTSIQFAPVTTTVSNTLKANWNKAKKAKPPSQCLVQNMWNDTWAIVEVPAALESMNTDTFAVRLKKPKQDNIDSTIDDDCDKDPETGFGAVCNKTYTLNNEVKPGLCKVENSRGGTAEIPGENLIAKGARFQQDNTQVFFNLSGNQLQEPLTVNSSTEFETQLPENLQPAWVTVQAKVNNSSSNKVPFRVISSSTAGKPRITSVSPSSTTKYSFITIEGENFGEDPGSVYIHQNRREVKSCFQDNPQDSCIKLQTNLRDYQCGVPWSKDQIIARIPSSTVSGTTYNLAVQSDQKQISNAGSSIIIEQGEPEPSICKIDPEEGPAPLLTNPQENNKTKITLTGINFTTTTPPPKPKLKYSRGLPQTKFTITSDQLISISSQTAETKLPTSSPSGVSMAPGARPISFARGGNSVDYQVRDCRKAKQETKENMEDRNYRCCPKGPDAGKWKLKTRACKGESRVAGYTWRFATANIPERPRAIEQCSLQGGSVEPSPSPRVSPENNLRSIGDGKKKACINANVQVILSMSLSNMDLSTINSSNIDLLKCNKGKNIDCSNSNQFQGDLDLNTGSVNLGPNNKGTKITILKNNRNNPELASSTWYRAKLTTGIRSLKKEQQVGRTVSSSFPLSKTRPCGGNSAYCFDFKTTKTITSTCRLSDALVSPTRYQTNKFGIVDNWQGDPLKYQVFGKADQACTVLNVENLDWTWFSSFDDGQKQSAAKNYVDIYASSTDSGGNLSDLNQTTRNIIKQSKDKAVVNAQNNTSSPVSINAYTEVSTTNRQTTETETGTSKLDITLGPPKITDKWPRNSCTAACPNGTIGAKFSRKMVSSTYYDSGIKNINLYRCTDGAYCNTLSKPLNIAKSSGGITDQMVEFKRKDKLQTSTWYKVEFTNNIRALGGYSPTGNIKKGKSLDPVAWTFKTKSNMKGCRVNSVDTQPLSFTETAIGNKKLYTAIPRGAPNNCSPDRGQRLASSNYDWNWGADSLDNIGPVAKVTNFAISPTDTPICNNQTCLLEGSDISLANPDVPLCGNGVVEPGEDCDIASTTPTGKDEKPGQSCSYNCLRPGNDKQGNSDNSCGNGDLEPLHGEECEIKTSRNNVKVISYPGNTTTIQTTTVSSTDIAKKLCSNKCTNKGVLGLKGDGSSSDKTVGGLANSTNSVQCYDGTPMPGEDCDPTTTPSASTPGCSARCTHLGTDLSRKWCENNPKSQPGNGCSKAVSVCGNGTLEKNEECEVNNGNELIYRKDSDNNTATITTSTAAKRCTDSCKLKDICPFKKQLSNNVDSDVQIVCDDPASPSCSNGCRIKGSNLNYKNSSICGDSQVGKGEYGACEPNNSGNFGNPTQVVTAKGKGVVTGTINAQVADIAASTSYYKNNSGEKEKLPNGSVDGTGDYFLQCGFESYNPPKPATRGQSHPRYNNCTKNSMDHGVAANTCCYPRVTTSQKYPAPGSDEVCRNTVISAEYPSYISPTTIEDNIYLARTLEDTSGSANNNAKSCQDLGMKDVSKLVSSTFAINTQFQTDSSGSWFDQIWNTLKGFFTKAIDFGYEVFAASSNRLDKDKVPKRTWCLLSNQPETKVKRKYSNTGNNVTTTINLKLSQVLEPNKGYSVFIEGGSSGLKDYRGVGVGTTLSTTDRLVDSWFFSTKKKNSDDNGICTVEGMDIQPESYTFKKPNTSSVFTAEALSSDDQRIQSTNKYNWKYDWGYTGYSIFNAPVDTNTTSRITVSSTQNEGDGTLRASLDITKNALQSNNSTGTQARDTSDLLSFFCASPWPGGKQADWNGAEWEKYKNDKYNFITHYCADAGSKATALDNLPLFGKFSSTNRVISQNNNSGRLENIDIGINGDVASNNSNLLVISNSSGDGVNLVSTRDKANPKILDSKSSNISAKFVEFTSNDEFVSIGPNGDIYSAEINEQNKITSTKEYSQSLSPTDLAVDGQNLFIAESGEINVANLSDLSTIVSSTKNGGGSRIKISRNYLYTLADSKSEINIHDISDPTAPSYVGSVNNISGVYHDLEAENDYLYLYSKTRGEVKIFSTSKQPESPQLVSTNNIPGNNINDFVVKDNFAYTYDRGLSSSTISIIDLSNPSNIKVRENIDLEKFNIKNQNQVQQMFELRNSLFFANDNNSNQIIDLLGLDNPVLPQPGAYGLRKNKKLAFNNKNEDVIGLQVFDNPQRKSARTWYSDKFGNVGEYNTVNIDRFDAITNGTNYYINALNVTSTDSGKEINNYILHLSVNENATAKTKKAFDKIINNLEFNTNLTNFGQCMKNDPNVVRSKKDERIRSSSTDFVAKEAFSCQNDFACRDNMGHKRLIEKSEIEQKISQILANPNLQSLTSTKLVTVTSTINDLSKSLNKNYETFKKKKGEIKGYFNNNPTGAGQPNFTTTSLAQGSSSLTPSSTIVKDISNLFNNTNLSWTSGYCSNVRDKLLRDWQRLEDMQQMSQAIKQDPSEMDSGTYYPGYTNSKWPSWQVLSQRVNSPGLPVDPVNKWTKCSTSSTSSVDPTTCWNAQTNRFTYPKFSQIYEYRYNTTSPQEFNIHVNFEYLSKTDPLDPIVSDKLADPTLFTQKGWRAKKSLESINPYSKKQCGDGIVQSSEECDPPGSTEIVGDTVKTCQSDCTLASSTITATCGNGVVEEVEICDDGALNGQYGQCAGGNSTSTIASNPKENEYQNNTNYQPGDQPRACQAKHPQYCGNGILDVDKNGNFLEACDTVNGKCKHKDGTVGSDPCKTYATSSANSCAANCQTRGGYCGDGIVQFNSPEECDDGNNNNDDKCTNNCKINEDQVEQEDDGPAQCGNGTVDEGEACDQGDQNGVKCTPEYGESCTYCAADCSEVLTVDPARACGNGKIDKYENDEGDIVFEKCDIRKNNQVISSHSCHAGSPVVGQDIVRFSEACNINNPSCKDNNKCKLNFKAKWVEAEQGQGYDNGYNLVKTNKGLPTTATCKDKGSYQCTNQCQTLQNDCVECNTYNSKNSNPQLAILNPVLAGNDGGSKNDTGEYFEKAYNDSNNLYWGEKKGGGQLYFDIIRPTSPSGLSYNNLAFKKEDGVTSGTEWIYLGQKRMLADENADDYRTLSSYIDIFNPNPKNNDNLNSSDGKSLRQNQMCSGEYKILFGTNGDSNGKISDDVKRSYKENLQNNNKPNDITKHGDLFDYPVNGGQGKIKNTIIASPVVPPQTVRVVVKWTKQESEKFGEGRIGDFYPSVYATSTVLDDGQWFNKIENGIVNQLEKEEIENKDFWVPSPSRVTNFDANTGDGSKISFHDIGRSGNQIIQSLTFDISDKVKRVPLVVRGNGKTIQQFQEGNIEVLVYTHKDVSQKKTLRSIYKPDYRFKIDQAEHSLNRTANYWHVFNINKANGEIVIENINGDEVKSTRINPNADINHGRIISRDCKIKQVATGEAPEGCY
jgi:cysteine-rich repeat protein